MSDSIVWVMRARICCGLGPFIGGSCLGIGNDNSQTRLVRGFERDSPSTAEKSLRSLTGRRELSGTTSADLKTDVVVNVQVRKSAAFLSSAKKREAMEENIE